MNRVIAIVMKVVAFGMGYLAGANQPEGQMASSPSSNSSTKLTLTTTDVEQVDEELASSQFTIQSDEPTQPINQPSNSKNKIAKSNGKHKVEGSADSALSRTSNHSEMTTNSEIDFPLAQREQKEWQDMHKAELKSQMEDSLGEPAKFMFEKIASESSILKESVAQTSLEEDIAWRYQAEQTVTDFIINNMRDPSTSVLQVVCIQKKCEITMTGNEQQAAIGLYMQFMGQKPLELKEASSPIFYMLEDKSYWVYLVLTFN